MHRFINFNVKSFLRGAGYSVYLLVSVVVLAEIGLRFYYSDPDYYWEHRYLYVTPDTYQNIDDKLWVYGPSRSMRDVAVYGFLDGGFRISYDCASPVNNIGLLQSRDFHSGDAVFGIIGDSYTAGHGGCPWFSQLEAAYPNQSFLNGGLMGTGIGAWRELIPYLQDKGIKLENILIIAISNDFLRPGWIWKDDQLACVNEAQGCDDEYWYPISPQASAEDLINLSKERALRRHGSRTAWDQVWQWVQRVSYIEKLLRRTGLFDFETEDSRVVVPTIIPEARETLEEIQKLGVPFHVMMVPQRDEVGLRQKNPTSRQVEALLGDLGIGFNWCEITGGDYMRYDGHPNAQGYAKIVACVSDLIDNHTMEAAP